MELIIASILATFLALFGHLSTVIAEQLRRPKRRVWRFGDDSYEPPPLKRSTRPSAASPRVAVPA